MSLQIEDVYSSQEEMLCQQGCSALKKSSYSGGTMSASGGMFNYRYHEVIPPYPAQITNDLVTVLLPHNFSGVAEGKKIAVVVSGVEFQVNIV